VTPEEWQIIDEAFQKALSSDGADRDVFLASFAADHPELAGQLADLLAADAESDDKLASPVAASVELLASEVVDPWAGATIGTWRIAHRIASGGMAAVFLADRTDGQFDQQVAIKIMSSQLLSPDAVTRFKSERQILADLSHPRIAQLHDGGTTDDGLPYLVMEYVDGLPVDDYCNEHELSIDARLQLFRKICDAVDYAHRNLIVHRDLKPSNILVDENGEPKLLDFGIAKLINTSPAEATVAMTREGTRAMTPEYASPEQVRSEPISVTSDVYSLGVLLYRLLTGQSPYGSSVSSSLDYERAIVEQEPAKPSTVVTDDLSNHTGMNQPGLSSNRLRSRLSGDLDNIILKTLQKDPERRYLSVAALAEDIRRYMHHEPVDARGADWIYIAKKFGVRNSKALVITALVLVGGAAMVTYYTVKLAAERDRAQLEATKATEVTEFLTELFGAAAPVVALGETITARMLLETGAARINSDLEAQPAVRAALLEAIGNSYASMRDLKRALPLLERSRELRDPNEPSAKLGQRIGYLLHDLGEYERALKELNSALRLETEANGRDTVLAGHIIRFIAATHTALGDFERADVAFNESIKILESTADDGLAQLAYAKTQYAHLQRTTGDLAAAEPLLLEALAIHESLYGDTHPAIATTLTNIGNHYERLGDPVRARDFYVRSLEVKRRLYDKDNISIARTIANLGVIELRLGNPAESERLSNEAMVIFRDALGEDHLHVIFLSENIADAQLAMGKHDQALATYLDSAERVGRFFGSDHFEYGVSTSNVGGAYIKTGQLENAEEALTTADGILRAALGDQHVLVAGNLVKLGQVSYLRDNHLRAVEYYEEALYIYAAETEAANVDEALALEQLGIAQVSNNDPVAAEQAFRDSLAQWTQLVESNLQLWRVSGRLGNALQIQGRLAEAEPLLREAYEASAAELPADDDQVVMISAWLEALNR